MEMRTGHGPVAASNKSHQLMEKFLMHHLRKSQRFLPSSSLMEKHYKLKIGVCVRTGTSLVSC